MTAFLEYSEAEHRYFANGVERKSVTQILDAAGMVSQFCRDEEARFRGSAVHELCAKDDVRPLDLRRVPTAFRGYLRAWRRYRKDSGFQAAYIEHRIDCAEYNYSGRFDRLGFIEGEPLATMLDIKTSKSGAVPDYARLQLIAYGYAFEPKGVFNRVAVALKPDGRYNAVFYPVSQYFIDRAEWLTLVIKHNNRQENN